MKNKELNEILQDDRAFEALVAGAMRKVGREADKQLMEELAEMSDEEMTRALAESQIEIKPYSRWRSVLGSVYVKAIAACVVCALGIWGVSYIPFGENDSQGYANMFETYYAGDKVNWEKFDAGDDLLNVKGTKSTASILQDATTWLSESKSKSSTRRAIATLEKLINNEWRKKSLDPEIRWYLGLAYLKDGRVDAAKEQFEMVKLMKKAHADEAVNVLSDLENVKGGNKKR